MSINKILLFPWLILRGGSCGLSLDPWKEGRKEDDD
jgi:hypothetical protein